MDSMKELNLNEMEMITGGKNEKGWEKEPKAKKGYTVYQIVPGDTMGKIAKAHNTTVEKIMKANPAITSPHLIVAGYWLYIPKK